MSNTITPTVFYRTPPGPRHRIAGTAAPPASAPRRRARPGRACSAAGRSPPRAPGPPRPASDPRSATAQHRRATRRAEIVAAAHHPPGRRRPRASTARAARAGCRRAPRGTRPECAGLPFGISVFNDHQLELRWLLHGEVARLRALQDLVHEGSGAPVEITKARPVRRPSFEVLSRVGYLYGRRRRLARCGWLPSSGAGRVSFASPVPQFPDP